MSGFIFFFLLWCHFKKKYFGQDGNQKTRPQIHGENSGQQIHSETSYTHHHNLEQSMNSVCVHLESLHLCVPKRKHQSLASLK